MSVTIHSRADLSLENARKVAREGESALLSSGAVAAMEEGRDRLLRVLEHDPEITVYGVTTGAGQLAKKKLKPEERKGWARMSPVGARELPGYGIDDGSTRENAGDLGYD